MTKTIIIITLFLNTFWGVQVFGQTWLDFDHGFGCDAYDLHDLYLDTETSQLTIRGSFWNKSNCDTLWNMSTWNGSAWVDLGCLSTMGGGGGMINYQNKIFTTGNQLCANGSQKLLHSWNGLVWENIWISDNSGFGLEMIVYEDVLYALGAYHEILNLPFSMLFAFDGEEIIPLISENSFESNPDQFGNTLAFYHDTLYVGGKFSGSSPSGRTDNIASVYDSSLHQLAEGLDYGSCIVEAICVHRDTLFIGGLFYPDPLIENDQLSALMYYDGYHLRSYGLSSSQKITCMKSYNNELYIGGHFEELNGSVCHGVAKLNGHQLIPLNTAPFTFPDGTHSTPLLRDLDILNDSLYICGTFFNIGSDIALGGVGKMNMALADVGIIENKPMFSSGNLQLFPNPASSQITLKGLPKNTFYDLHIYDSSGRIVSNIQHSNVTNFNSEHLQNGVYFVSVISNDLVYQMRFIKE